MPPVTIWGLPLCDTRESVGCLLLFWQCKYRTSGIKTGHIVSMLDVWYVQYQYWTLPVSSQDISSIDTGHPVLILGELQYWVRGASFIHDPVFILGIRYRYWSPCIVTGGIFWNPISIQGSCYPVLRLDRPVSRLGQLQYRVQHRQFVFSSDE